MTHHLMPRRGSARGRAYRASRGRARSVCARRTGFAGKFERTRQRRMSARLIVESLGAELKSALPRSQCDRAAEEFARFVRCRTRRLAMAVRRARARRPPERSSDGRCPRARSAGRLRRTLDAIRRSVSQPVTSSEMSTLSAIAALRSREIVKPVVLAAAGNPEILAGDAELTAEQHERRSRADRWCAARFREMESRQRAETVHRQDAVRHKCGSMRSRYSCCESTIDGYRATSKKSALRRCSSRCARSGGDALRGDDDLMSRSRRSARGV